MKIDIGLYQAKYTLRAILDRIPGIERLSPNAVSLSSLIPAALAAYSLWAGWWLLVAVAIAARMVLVTLDGLIAEGYNKKTRAGPWVNRVPGVLGDVMLFVAWALIIAPPWGILLMGLVWPVNVFGILGLVAGGGMQSVGPAGRVRPDEPGCRRRLAGAGDAGRLDGGGPGADRPADHHHGPAPESELARVEQTGRDARLLIHTMISAHWEPLAFELPDAMATVGAGWRRFIDTALPAGADIQEWTTAPVVSRPDLPGSVPLHGRPRRAKSGVRLIR